MRRLALFVDKVVYRNENALFCEERFEESHVSYVHFTYKDVDSFRHGSVHELYSSKECQTRNVCTLFSRDNK